MDREKLKWVFGLGIILMLAGVSILFVPSIGALSDVTVDSTPPTIDTFKPAGTKSSPTTYDAEVDSTMVISEVSVSDSLSGVKVVYVRIHNEDEGSDIVRVGTTTHYSKIRNLLLNYDADGNGNISQGEATDAQDAYNTGDLTRREIDEVMYCHGHARSIDSIAPAGVSVTSTSITVEAGDIFSESGGQASLPVGEIISYSVYTEDKAGKSNSVEGYSTAEAMTPSGYFTINGRKITNVHYVTKNEITWGFKATSYSEYVTGVTVDIDTQGGSNVKEISLTQDSGDTWEKTDTLSDGRYTVKGVVNGNTLLQCTFGLNTEEQKPLIRSETLGIILAIAGIVLAGYSGEELFLEKS